MTAGPRVVAIGGGHGLAVTVRAVRTYAQHLTAVVATADDGGSSGRLRAEFPIPAPGDLRRCLTTLATDQGLAADLEHRIQGDGELAGHAVGNLVLAGLLDAGHDLSSAAQMVGRWLGLDPATVAVYPATVEAVTPIGSSPAGAVRGQVAIERDAHVQAVALDPPAPAVPVEVLAAIDAADQVVLGPGSFLTSVVATAAVPAIRDALAGSNAPLVLVANLHDAERAPVDVDHHVGVLEGHGIRVDAVVVDRGTRAPVGPTPDVVVDDIARPHGLAHDADRLGPVLAALGGF